MAGQEVVHRPGRTAGEITQQPVGAPAIPQAAAVSETGQELPAGIALPHADPAGRSPVPAIAEALVVPAVLHEHAAAQQASASQASVEPYPLGKNHPGIEPLSPPRPGTLTAPPLPGAFAVPPQPPAPVPPSEPTVNVTIGRVEIRAVTAPTPPARREQREQAARTMSLDEYLAERNQRRRA